MARTFRWLCLPASGALFALAYPASGWWPLAFVSLVPLLLEMWRESAASAAWLGASWGAGFFTLLLSWLYPFFRHYGRLGPLPSAGALAVLVSYLAVYPGLFALLGSRLLRRYGSAGMGLLPMLWVALEWIRGHALSGFPWGLAGYALVPCLPLVQISSVTGVYGVSFLVVLANTAIAGVVLGSLERFRGAFLIASAAALALAGAAIFGVLEMSAPAGDGPATVVGVVQAGIPQDEKWSAEAASAILEKHRRMTEEAAAEGARLILWPESSSPFPLSRPRWREGAVEIEADQSYRETLASLARRLGAAILFGTVDYREERGEVRPVNAAALVRPDGSWAAPYAKMHLVPFGEYVPLAPLLSFVNRIAQGAIGEFVPGRRFVVARADSLSVGTSICYEMIFPELVRRFPLRGAEVLTNLTNDAWFGETAGPYQHLQMAVLRAVENRRYLIRAANTGISAIVDPRGRVLDRTDLEVSRVLTGRIRPVKARTLYTRCGDVFAILCAILAAAALAAGFAVVPRRFREERIGNQ
jgi:apolipoprotein N-acyltransferase